MLSSTENIQYSIYMAGFSQRYGLFIFNQTERLQLRNKYAEDHEVANFGFQVYGCKKFDLRHIPY